LQCTDRTASILFTPRTMLLTPRTMLFTRRTGSDRVRAASRRDPRADAPARAGGACLTARIQPELAGAAGAKGWDPTGPETPPLSRAACCLATLCFFFFLRQPLSARQPSTALAQPCTPPYRLHHSPRHCGYGARGSDQLRGRASHHRSILEPSSNLKTRIKKATKHHQKRPEYGTRQTAMGAQAVPWVVGAQHMQVCNRCHSACHSLPGEQLHSAAAC
jgi:hypothetical protein